jgi:hypothetical protein
MSDNNLFCSSLLVKIGDLTNLKTKYEDKLDQASDDFEYRRDMEIYKDISSDLKYKHTLYRNRCVGLILVIWFFIFLDTFIKKFFL